jgi:hypothetical protein
MARAFVTSVVVFAAGELVVAGVGEALVFGEAEALGLGEGEGDFLVAAFAAKGAQPTRATVQAVMRWNLFFIGWGGCWEYGSSQFIGARQLQLQRAATWD